MAAMTTGQIPVQRFSVISSKPFESVVAALEAVVGHPNFRDKVVFQGR
jgi:hypothetical protein